MDVDKIKPAELETLQHVFWYPWIRHWPVNRWWFVLLLVLAFYGLMLATVYLSDSEQVTDVIGLRLLFAMTIVFAICAPILLMAYLEKDARRVMALMPDESFTSAQVSRKMGYLVYLIGVGIGCAVGLLIEGDAFFMKLITEPNITVPGVCLMLVIGPSSAIQHYGAWKVCRWMESAASRYEVDLLQAQTLEVFVRPVFRGLVLMVVALGLGPIVFLMEERWVFFGFLILGLAMLLVCTLSPIFIRPLLAVRRRINAAKLAELALIGDYFAGDQAALNQLRPASLGYALTFSDVINWQARVESTISIPITESLKRNLLLFLLPIGSWGAAIIIELLF